MILFHPSLYNTACRCWKQHAVRLATVGTLTNPGVLFGVTGSAMSFMQLFAWNCRSLLTWQSRVPRLNDNDRERSGMFLDTVFSLYFSMSSMSFPVCLLPLCIVSTAHRQVIDNAASMLTTITVYHLNRLYSIILHWLWTTCWSPRSKTRKGGAVAYEALLDPKSHRRVSRKSAKQQLGSILDEAADEMD